MDDLGTALKLRAAANYLRVNGWHQGGSWGANGAVCAAQAMVLTCGVNAHDYAQFLGLRRPTEKEFETLVQGRSWCDLPDTIPGWNDTPGRTVEEVLDRLESGALALEIRALAHESVTPEPVLV